MPKPLFIKIDNYLIRVPDLDKALEFYSNKLGHRLKWRVGNETAGLRLPGTDAELVLVAERGKAETDLLVKSVDAAVKTFVKAGGKVVHRPFDINVGKCAVVRDPWGNDLVFIDLSKGIYKTDKKGNVVNKKIS
jgi:predicted enzyme related to lactoylglutathione lyase